MTKGTEKRVNATVLFVLAYDVNGAVFYYLAGE
jgi:hypothetical protein